MPALNLTPSRESERLSVLAIHWTAGQASSPNFADPFLLLRLDLLPHDAGLSARGATLKRADSEDFMSREVWLMYFEKLNLGAVRVGAGGEKG